MGEVENTEYYEIEEDKTPQHPCLKYSVTLCGCIQIVELISCIIAFGISMIDTSWLREAGGGFVTFIALLCAVFALTFYVTHTQIDEYMKQSKWQLAEWLGYLIGCTMLLVSIIISIRACGMHFIKVDSHGRDMLLQNSHIVATALFLFLSFILFGIHSAIFSLHRYKKYRTVLEKAAQSS